MPTFRIDPVPHTLEDGSETEVFLVIGPSGVVLRSFATKENAASHLVKLSNHLEEMTPQSPPASDTAQL